MIVSGLDFYKTTNLLKSVKNIAILGCTGSIGQNSLEVISKYPDRFKAAFLSANKAIDLLKKQIEIFKPLGIGVTDENSALQLKSEFGNSLKIFTGSEGLEEISAHTETDVVINSLVGFTGLRPTIAAIKSGKTIALANKETLVAAGEIITTMTEKYNTTLLPIDSEHSAILQCLTGEDKQNISELIITASGGPLLNLDKSEFEKVTVEQALNHPNWKMGSKITIDSATLMNKGLEVIEAHYIFKIPAEKIKVVIHPQSIIHSMVEFIDGSIKAQLSIPDMKIPIQYALTYPERLPLETKKISFPDLEKMTFYEPDTDKFECLGLAYQALKSGGIAPAVLNAANEVAVNMFLSGEINFNRIPELIRDSLNNQPNIISPTIEDIFEADASTRNFIFTNYLSLTNR